MKTMKTGNNTLIAAAVTVALTSAAMTSPFANAKDKAFEGVVVEQVVVIGQFPEEVQSGSIRVSDDSDQVIAKQAGLSIAEAAAIAGKALPGTVIKAKLDDENGFLVWEVKVLGPEGQEAKLMIDAGNGRLLAIDADEDEKDEHKEKHSKWKFWEDGDRDEQSEQGE